MEKPYKRVDSCDTCLDFDRNGLPALKHAVATVRCKLCKDFPSFFNRFDEVWGDTLSENMQTAKGVEAMRTFIATHGSSTMGGNPYDPARLRLFDEEKKAKVLLSKHVECLGCTGRA